MNLQDILFGSSGITVILMTLLEVSKIPINPWSTLAKWIGRALNADLMAEIKELKSRLDEHIQTDDERNADLLRTQILRFNDELVHVIPSTRKNTLMRFFPSSTTTKPTAGHMRITPTTNAPTPSATSAGSMTNDWKSTILCERREF